MGNQRPFIAAAAAAAGLAALYRGHVKRWMYRWGATDGEVIATLPGDEWVTPGAPRTTRAITIDAPREAVWPWLAQIGEDRGGFYSYSLLERVVGAHVNNTNTNTIHQEWQDLHVGDAIWLARRHGERSRQMVAAMEPNSRLLLMAPDDYARVQNGQKASGAWGFYLTGQSGRTRLLVRGSGGVVGRIWFDVPHFVMEQKMMRGICERAQRSWRPGVITMAHNLFDRVDAQAVRPSPL